MNAKQKRTIIEIVVTVLLFAAVFVCDHSGLFDCPRIKLALYLVPYIVIGRSVLKKAVLNIVSGNAFDESFLMTVATVAAFAIGEYSEATAVMLFYQIGEFFQSYAVGKSRASIAEMMSIAPEYANLETPDGIKEVDPEEVNIGDIIVIRAGEKIPLDGVVTEGESFVDTAALTGESVPRRVSAGDDVISGCVNGEGILKVKVAKKYEDSTVAKILELVENASSKKARLENFITRFARVYTPIVTVSALLLAVIPPLLFGYSFADWIERACIFLIVSCPCALVISVPLGFFGGIGAASKIGVLVKGSSYLEAVSEVKTIVFDKTGTLTKGEFKVSRVLPNTAAGFSSEELLRLAAHAESLSNHPIAKSIANAYGGKIETEKVSLAKETAGRGVAVNYDGKNIAAGNCLLLDELGVEYNSSEDAGTVVHVACDGTYAGCIVISDEIKNGVREALSEMRSAGIRKLVMLSGDRVEAAESVAGTLGIDEFRAQLLPVDKVSEVEKLISEEKNGKVAFVGDGINDAPVLMRADVGIAMGSLGSDAAIEAADVVLMDDDIRKISSIIRISRKTMAIVRENITFALAVKFLVLILGAIGVANMWEAVFGDVGVTVLAIFNSMRAMRSGKKPANL
ncbi:cadmium-translocating P-type ATPase [bacterium]|nr:cadmium-translocating P-type ATPase [bacterium]